MSRNGAPPRARLTRSRYASISRPIRAVSRSLSASSGTSMATGLPRLVMVIRSPLATRSRRWLAFGSAVGAFAQQKRPADVAKEADVAKDVRRDIGGESNGNWGWIGLLGLAGLAGLLGRYRDGANRSGTNYTRDR